MVKVDPDSGLLWILVSGHHWSLVVIFGQLLSKHHHYNASDWFVFGHYGYIMKLRSKHNVILYLFWLMLLNTVHNWNTYTYSLLQARFCGLFKTHMTYCWPYYIYEWVSKTWFIFSLFWWFIHMIHESNTCLTVGWTIS